jgi:hypothetical protein
MVNGSHNQIVMTHHQMSIELCHFQVDVNNDLTVREGNQRLDAKGEGLSNINLAANLNY